MPATALPPWCAPLGLIIIPSPDPKWIYTHINPSGAGIAPRAKNKACDPELQHQVLFGQHWQWNCPWLGVGNNAGLWSAGVIHIPALLEQGGDKAIAAGIQGFFQPSSPRQQTYPPSSAWGSGG